MMINTIIPLVYGLLVGKSTDDYNWFFEKVFKKDKLQPESTDTDFESGTIKSTRQRPQTFCIKACPLLFIKLNSETYSWLSLSLLTINTMANST